MKVRMQGLERRREALEAGLTTVTEPKPRLHPGLAEVYQQKGDAAGSAGGQGRPRGARAIRALVEAIVLVPEDRKLAIEVRGISRRSWPWIKRQRPGAKAGC